MVASLVLKSMLGGPSTEGLDKERFELNTEGACQPQHQESSGHVGRDTWGLEKSMGRRSLQDTALPGEPLERAARRVSKREKLVRCTPSAS